MDLPAVPARQLRPDDIAFFERPRMEPQNDDLDLDIVRASRFVFRRYVRFDDEDNSSFDGSATPDLAHAFSPVSSDSRFDGMDF
jgi:hypothetical protein